MCELAWHLCTRAPRRVPMSKGQPECCSGTTCMCTHMNMCVCMCVGFSEICPFDSYLRQRDLLTETLWAGPVPGAVALAAEGRCAQEVEAVVALVGHSGAEAKPVGPAGVDLPDAVLLVPRIRTVDDCHGK